MFSKYLDVESLGAAQVAQYMVGVWECQVDQCQSCEKLINLR